MSLVSICWCLSPNVGDALSPWLVSRLGHEPVYFDQAWAGQRTLLSGSILNWAKPGDIAWGVGLASMSDRVRPGVKIRSVRGPLSRDRALACGVACPPVFGDAAMILPLLYTPQPKPERSIGIIPHYTDMYRVLHAYSREDVISPLLPVEQFVDEVCSRDLIVSSSLHGLVIAHAYGKKAAWVQFSDSLYGDGTKFRDHLMAVGIEPYKPTDCRLKSASKDNLLQVANSSALPSYTDVSRRMLYDALPDYLRAAS